MKLVTVTLALVALAAFADPGVAQQKGCSLVGNPQLALQLTQNHLPMVQALQRPGPNGRVKSLRDLDEVEWRKLIEKKVDGKPVGFPPDTPGKDDAEKISNYAKALTRKFRGYVEAFPHKCRD